MSDRRDLQTFDVRRFAEYKYKENENENITIGVLIIIAPSTSHTLSLGQGSIYIVKFVKGGRFTLIVLTSTLLKTIKPEVFHFKCQTSII